MKLHALRSACSLAPHIVLRELDLPFELSRYDRATRKVSDGRELVAINPKGYVPVLEFDDGSVLTEVSAILQYLADQRPEKRLAPAAGTMERVRLQEWLSYLSTDLHKLFPPLWNKELPAVVHENAKSAIADRCDYLSRALADREYLLGTFSVADVYLYVILGWMAFAKIDLARWPVLKAFHERVGARDTVKAAIQAERPPA